MAWQVDAMARSNNGSGTGYSTAWQERAFAVEAEIVYSADPAASGFGGGRYLRQLLHLRGLTMSGSIRCFPVLAPRSWADGCSTRRVRACGTRQRSWIPSSSGLPLLTQMGIVSPSRGESPNRLIAYTTVWVGDLPFVEVVSRGKEDAHRRRGDRMSCLLSPESPGRQPPDRDVGPQPALATCSCHVTGVGSFDVA